jgi:Ca-activated chloride channel family protein
MAGEMTLQCTLARENALATNTPQLAYVLMEARPTGAMANVQMPLNFSLVLDHSGSMSGQPLHSLKEAVKLLLGQMKPQDVVSIVLFEERAQVLVPGQPLSNVAHLQAVVDSIREAGGTKMSEGMNLGLAEVQKNLQGNRVNRILLFTDGQTWEDESRCEALAVQAGGMGVPIVALGLGLEWNDRLLDSIARASQGVSDKIDTPQQIVPVFSKALQSMQATVVTNAQLTLRLVGGVAPRQVWRVVPLITRLDHRAISDRDIQVYLGDMEKDQGQSVLAELTLPPRGVGRYRLAQAEVAYDVPMAGLTGQQVRADVLANFTADPALAQQANPRVMNIVEKVTAFKLQTQALDEAAVHNIAAATQKLRAAATILLDMGETELAQTAQQALQNLQQQGQVGQVETKKLRYETQKLTQKLDDLT